jgi:hypothetical protein
MRSGGAGMMLGGTIGENVARIVVTYFITKRCDDAARVFVA